MRRLAATSSSAIASASRRAGSARGPRKRIRASSRATRSTAQRRFTAVGRVAARSAHARSSDASDGSARIASARPCAAATPMRGAPRTCIDRIPSAAASTVGQRTVVAVAGEPPLVDDDDGGIGSVVLPPDRAREVAGHVGFLLRRARRRGRPPPRGRRASWERPPPRSSASTASRLPPGPPPGARRTSAGRGRARRAPAHARRPTVSAGAVNRRLWPAPPVSTPARARSSAPSSAGSAAASNTSRAPEARAISRPCPSRPKPVTSVAPRMPWLDEDLGRGAVERAHLVDRGLEVRVARQALAPAAHEEPRAEPLGEQQHVAGSRAALAEQPVGVRRADDRQPVLRLRVADRVAAGEHAARLADLRTPPPRTRPPAPASGSPRGTRRSTARTAPARPSRTRRTARWRRRSRRTRPGRRRGAERSRASRSPRGPATRGTRRRRRAARGRR